MSEGPSCYSASNPTARKQHLCCECRGVIQPGEKYHVFSGIWDGEAGTYKTCADCEVLRADVCKMFDLHADDTPAFGWLYNELDGFECVRRWIAILEKRGMPVGESWRNTLEQLAATPAEGKAAL